VEQPLQPGEVAGREQRQVLADDLQRIRPMRSASGQGLQLQRQALRGVAGADPRRVEALQYFSAMLSSSESTAASAGKISANSSSDVCR